MNPKLMVQYRWSPAKYLHFPLSVYCVDRCITGMMYIKSFIEKDDFSVSDAGGLEKNLSTANRSQTHDPSGY